MSLGPPHAWVPGTFYNERVCLSCGATCAAVDDFFYYTDSIYGTSTVKRQLVMEDHVCPNTKEKSVSSNSTDIHINLLTLDDWEGLYIDGELVLEGHSLDAEQVLSEIANAIPGISSEILWTDDDLEMTNSRCPKTWKEVETLRR